jgi:predicted DNA-binding protein with PD1-like motif
MQYRKTNYGYIVVLELGESVMESLRSFAEKENILHGTFSGIGAVRATECCIYDIAAKKYKCRTFDDAHEVLSLSGNFAKVDDAPFVHAHIVLGNGEMQAYGGHLKEAIVAVTLEIAVTVDPSPIARTQNDAIGLKLITL